MYVVGVFFFLSFRLNWLIVILSALKCVEMYTNKAATP